MSRNQINWTPQDDQKVGIDDESVKFSNADLGLRQLLIKLLETHPALTLSTRRISEAWSSDPHRRPMPRAIHERLSALHKVPTQSALPGRASKDSLRQIPSTSNTHDLKRQRIEGGSEDSMLCKVSRSQQTTAEAALSARSEPLSSPLVLPRTPSKPTFTSHGLHTPPTSSPEHTRTPLTQPSQQPSLHTPDEENVSSSSDAEEESLPDLGELLGLSMGPKAHEKMILRAVRPIDYTLGKGDAAAQSDGSEYDPEA